ncbi:hypothetical protein EC9_53290 [Rosistilla ulvae]|uniref:Antitoxin Xre/MbcA/ParS-like toxin-binding domain-containing protein n=1 Tax=Rosistilla ulvae TaxID=1930277 RepID=A0A517M8B6_9BACT|nr:hypothetical protein [Rosistilla ulvae]QDS91109.1 hypothetical protein EC9_53290 [Rosistilla ulvae]
MTTEKRTPRAKAVKNRPTKRVTARGGKVQARSSKTGKRTVAMKTVSTDGTIVSGNRSGAKNVIVSTGVRGLKGQGLLQVGQVKKLELRDRLGMPRQMFGRIVNVAERTIAKVESGSADADKLIRPYNEVYRLWEALGDLVDPESLGLWFQTPNDSFDGLKPVEVIERGEIDRLWDMVFELQTGMPG